MPGACETSNVECENNATSQDGSQLEVTNDASTCSKGESKSSFLFEDGDSVQQDNQQASPSYLGKRRLSDEHSDNSISNEIFPSSFSKSSRFSDETGDLSVPSMSRMPTTEDPPVSTIVMGSEDQLSNASTKMETSDLHTDSSISAMETENLPVSSIPLDETSGAVLVLQAIRDNENGCNLKIEGDLPHEDGELINEKTHFLEFMKDVDRLEPEQFLSQDIKDPESINVQVSNTDDPELSTSSHIYIALDPESSGFEPGQQYTIVTMQTLQPHEDDEIDGSSKPELNEQGESSECHLTKSDSQDSEENTSMTEKYEDSIPHAQSSPNDHMPNPQMYPGHYPRPYCNTQMQEPMSRYQPQMDTPRYAPLHPWNGYRTHVSSPHPQSMYGMPSHQHPMPNFGYGRGMRQNMHFPSPYQPGYPQHQQQYHPCPSAPLHGNLGDSPEEHLENIPPENQMPSNSQNLPMVDTFLSNRTIGPLDKPNNFYSIPYQGRENHNEKERKRRGRIKNSCQLMRELVPGLGEKTDKATVFEFCVQYLLHLKRIVGNKYDKEFVEKYNPY